MTTTGIVTARQCILRFSAGDNDDQPTYGIAEIIIVYAAVLGHMCGSLSS